MFVETNCWTILANQRKGVPQKLRALLFTLSHPMRLQNSKFSGNWGQILDLLLLLVSTGNKDRYLM